MRSAFALRYLYFYFFVTARNNRRRKEEEDEKEFFDFSRSRFDKFKAGEDEGGSYMAGITTITMAIQNRRRKSGPKKGNENRDL